MTIREEELSRRRFLQRAATIGWTTPLIVSALTSPAFASHVPVGSPCNATTQHCVATSTSSAATGSVVRAVECCGPGIANAGTCGFPTGTVIGSSGSTADCARCCVTGLCGAGQQNRTCVLT